MKFNVCLKWNTFGAILILLLNTANAQQEVENNCYGSGSIATAVILSIIFTAILLLTLIYYFYKRRRNVKG